MYEDKEDQRKSNERKEDGENQGWTNQESRNEHEEWTGDAIDQEPENKSKQFDDLDPVPGKKEQFQGKQLKGMKRFGYFALAVGIGLMFLTGTPTVDTSEPAKDALENQISTSISAGTILLEADESLEPRDFSITHSSSNDETKIWIWDYAAEDGDYVQVLVDGVPIADSFMIKHKPREITVPSTGSIQIKGIRDGGGGITYAVRYDINGTTYFNTAPEGEYNTYELVRE